MGITPLQQDNASVAVTQGPTGARAVGRVAGLIAGDALAFLVFAVLGRGQHHETTGLAALGQVIVTALPFALGWFLVAPLVGAYRRAATDMPARTLRRTLLAWLAAWPVTLLLRWAFTGRIPLVTFALIILIANAILLGLWRFAFALAERWLASRAHAAQ